MFPSKPSPTSSDPSLDIPLPVAFTLLNIIIHLNVAFIAFEDDIRLRSRISEVALHPLPYQLSYAIAAVPFTLSLFLRKPWQSSSWWSLTLVMVFIVQTVTSSIIQGNESISELETLRYRSPGA